MKKRLTAMLLCVAMLLTFIPIMPTQAYSDTLSVQYNGSAVQSVTLPQNEKVKLTAVSTQADSAKYQWQILTNGSIWVDISGAKAATLDLSYAMVASVLKDGKATVRCQSGSAASNEVTVTVDYSAPTPVKTTSGAATKSLVVSPAMVVSTPKTLSADTGIALAAAEGDGTGAAGETTEPTTPELKDYSVVINYVFENNEVVADPYTASLAAGSNFSATVNHPTVQGYLPYVGTYTETSTSIELNITNIQADVIYTVTYKPTNVNYTVIHYQQNVDNDNYTIKETETKQGLTNSTVPEVGKTYEGFYALLYEKPAIAADGSTVVEVYYDRYYYLMNFDLDGGYGVEPIYARYGSPVSVGTPTKAGYTFSGWDPTVPATVPANGGTYKAQWTANDTAKVSVVFWGENANDEEYSYLTTGVVDVKPGTEYTFVDGQTVFLICGKEAHTHTADCTLTCGKEEHTTHTENCLGNCIHPSHELDCYQADNDRDLIITTKPDAITSYGEEKVYTYLSNRTNYYYLYLGGQWYCAQTRNGGASPTTEISLSCSHTHTTDCYTCEVHTHTAACYSCGMEEHTHTDSCNQTGSGLDNDLWTFVRSETVTVAADGSSVVNVYYDRVEFTFTFIVDRTTVHTFSAKWGSNIREKWTFTGTNGTTYSPDNKDSWTGNVLYTQRIYMVEIMPAQDITFTRASGRTSSNTFYYYVESVENTAGENKRQFEDKYYDYYFKLINDFGELYYDEDFFELEGFTRYKSARENGNEYPLSNSGTNPIDNLYFYYTRNSYSLVFNDGYTDVKTESVKYEAPLSTYDSFVPEVPSAYEPGSVEFVGWYLNPECTGDEYILSEHTMPASNLILYAKWVPVTHTVEFYLDADALAEGTKIGETHPDLTVPHGSKVETVPAEPDNGDYEFVGWFYMDGNTEKAFDFSDMPVNKDMKVYAKWSSNVLKEYFVYYKYKDADGSEIEIADSTTGSALAGITKTFDAKGGTDLYADYQEGYFPVTKSHSMTIDIKEGADNSFTFWYVQKDAVPYTVYYVTETLKDGENAANYETITRDGKTYYIIADTKIDNENRKAVVTETFVPVSGYMPDAYQKRLVVDASENAVNEIIFYYTEDTVHAYYKITHYTQNTDGETWTEYASSEVIGDIGKEYTATPITIDGFTYDSTVQGTVTSGKLTANGLELKLYYTRNSYPYEVRYLEQGTGAELATPKTGFGKYGQVISESAIDIEGYTPVAPTSQTLTIKIEESQTEAKLNIITFYYTEKEVTINYVAVGPEGATNFGSVTPTTETVKVKSGTAQGSTATASSNVYKFVGWYSDAACTKLLRPDAKFVPEKVDGKNVAATYYAKFEYNLTTLTISKTVTGEVYDADDTFIFDVKDSDDNVITTVTLKHGGSVTINGVTVGETYTVTERDTSKRYTGAKTESVIAAVGGSEVSFTNTASVTKWLTATESVKNVFGNN